MGQGTGQGVQHFRKNCFFVEGLKAQALQE